MEKIVIGECLHTSTDVYKYTIDTENGKYFVELVFVNGEFSHTKFEFNCPYTRLEWEILAAINDLITQLESTYKSAQPSPTPTL